VTTRAHPSNVLTLPERADVYTRRAHASGQQVLMHNLDGNPFAAAFVAEAVERWLVALRDRLDADAPGTSRASST
jgi:hypothetical protein